jgi:hypothetical protein
MDCCVALAPHREYANPVGILHFITCLIFLKFELTLERFVLHSLQGIALWML